MNNILMSPPVAFMILLALSLGFTAVSKRLSARGTESVGKYKSYACGEDMPENQGQPEYTQFFRFAFFFTIMHVVVLVVATNPAGLTAMTAVYLGVTILSLFMLFRR